MTSHSASPISICPAQYGGGADINTAEFTFVVEGAGGSATVIEAFGFYRDREFKDADDLLSDRWSASSGRVAHRGYRPGESPPILTRLSAPTPSSAVARCQCDAAARGEGGPRARRTGLPGGFRTGRRFSGRSDYVAAAGRGHALARYG
jgi:hypothetical protein